MIFRSLPAKQGCRSIVVKVIKDLIRSIVNDYSGCKWFYVVIYS